MGTPGRKKKDLRSKAFRSDDELLESARRMFRARALVTRKEAEGAADQEAARGARRAEREATGAWHEAFGRSLDRTVLGRCARKNRLNRAEREIVAALALNQLGLLEEELRAVRDVLRLLAPRDRRVLPTLRMLAESGRLHRRGLIFHANGELDLKERPVFADPTLVEGILYGGKGRKPGWPVKTERELLDRLGALTRAFMNKAEAAEGVEKGWEDAGNLFKRTRAVQRLLDGLAQTLRLHPRWKLCRLLFDARGFSWTHRRVLLVLLGKELGHVEADDDLFTGIGIARAVSDDVDQVRGNLRLLGGGELLCDGAWVRPCDGSEVLLDGDAGSLAGAEFELAGKALEVLGLTRSLVKRREGAASVRPARVRLESLVLPRPVREALELARAQARHGRVLLENWGMAKAVPYGRAVTLLFAGLPGTGKTACAEGLARSLRKPILVADYSQIQNCFVGGTEKNIVRTFRDARAHDALLFWDEADAMFFDREGGARSWEVRDVNVLLQEIERFEGVCVLATNREVVLDRALERRITLKVRFEAPDRSMRLRIWKSLIPRSLPVRGRLDLPALAEAELTGGEIKNAVLNAARRALARDPRGGVAMEDFRKAVQSETEGRWSRDGGGRIGF